MNSETVLAVAEALFDCEQGDQRAYHLTNEGERYDYVTLGFVTSGWIGRKRAVERAFCELLCAVRKALPTARPKLYWRKRPEIERSLMHCWIRARLAIPGVDWTKYATKPEGLPYPQVK